MPDPISRMARSWRLAQASWNVLRSETGLLVLPALSGITMMAVFAAFAAEALSSGMIGADAPSAHSLDLARWLPSLFVLYVAQYFVVFFFNTALVGAALQKLQGGNPGIGSALALAFSRIDKIFGYAVIAATVGLLIQALEQRLGIIGRLVVGAVGMTWTLATFLVVPILAAENLGPFEAIAESARLLKKSWGENLIGKTGISLVIALIAAPIMIVGISGGVALYQHGLEAVAIPLIAAAVASLIALMLVGAALSAIYQAAVYYYAVNGEPPADFDMVRHAFLPKRG